MELKENNVNYEDNILISKPYYYKTDGFFKEEGYRIDNKFSENYHAVFPIFKGGMTKTNALKKANSFYDFVKNVKNEGQYEKLVQNFIENWNAKYFNGGSLGFYYSIGGL